jgi:hypothetical protein
VLTALGTPYLEGTHSKIQRQEFVKLCQEFGVVARPFGRTNPSIMSSGLKIQHCHAVTVAHALWRMTWNYCERSDWRIDLA